jgi:hypothetical protein
MKTRRNNRDVRWPSKAVARSAQYLLLSTLFFTIFGATSPAAAAIMFLAGSDEPLHVLTIREDAASVVVGLPQADGTFTERVYEKRQIEDFIRTVDAKRLAELSPEKPSAYRDYAEELAEKKADPDARAAALRLYVIAAQLDPDNLGRSSLLGMTALARSPLEERRIRAMSYLLDPAHDASVLKGGGSSPTASTTAEGDASGRESLLSMLRLLRKGQGPIARRTAERKESEAIFAQHGRGLTQKQFLALCRGGQTLAPEQLARLIRLELALSGGAASAADDEPAGGKSTARPSWSEAISSGDTKPIAPLSLETLTEFDPRLSVYRDGKWTAP